MTLRLINDGSVATRGGENGYRSQSFSGEAKADPFDPLLYLPSQVPNPRTEPALGERRLLRAMLEDAISCASKTAYFANRRRTPHRITVQILEAEAWIRSNRFAPFSFRWACDVLGIEPERIRERIRRQVPVWEVRRAAK